MWRLRLNEKTITQVTTTPGFESRYQTDPLWSPDGKWLALTHDSSNSRFRDVYLVEADGQNQAPKIRFSTSTEQVRTTGRMSWH